MNSVRTIMGHLWTHVKKFLNIIRSDVPSAISTAKECLRRTKDAYYIIALVPIKNQITERQLDEIIRNADSIPNLEQMLEQAGVHDRLYECLLIMTIWEVYKTSAPPTIEHTIRPKLK